MSQSFLSRRLSGWNPVRGRSWWDVIARKEHEAARKLLRESLPSSQSTFLDLGCGSGALWDGIGGETYIIGLDLFMGNSPTLKIKSVRGDANRLPVKSSAVDGIVALGLIEYLHDLPAVFAEWRRVVRPGGVLLLSNSPAILPNRIRALIDPMVTARADQIVTRSLEDAGWLIVKSSLRRAGWQTLFVAQADSL
jgi:SAM-dependent methyltransferase